jgi:RecA-family ATPase
MSEAEISTAVADELASWRRIFAARKEGVDPRALLRNAAGDLWKILQIDATVHPDSNGVARQEVVDALQIMAEGAAIAPDDAQRIFSESFRAQPKHDEQPEAKPETDNEPLPYIDIARDPIPPRDWAVRDRIPARNVALLSGEGAVGKSTLLLQLSAATVLARDWIGVMPEPGPVMYLGCEDDDDETRRRLEAIAEHYSCSRAEMKRSGLHVLDFVGKDAILGQPDRSDHIRPTPLFERIKSDAIAIRPKIFVVDTVADVFAGNENNRSQTRQFITLMRGLAIASGGSVILASHPSLTGISSDTGMSGSTAWHNGPRARGYFKQAPEENLRLLEWRKNNYGPVSESIVLRWRDGVYVPEPRVGSFEQMAEDAKIDNLFLDLLRRLAEQGRNVSPSRSPTYAPSVFASQKEAKEAKIKVKAFTEAMERLLAAEKILVVKEGPPSRQRERIAEAGEDTPHLLRIVGEAPGATCIQCHAETGEPVLKIKNTRTVGAKPETLHMACAPTWFQLVPS